MEKVIRTISLFSGAGGLDTGAINAGASIVWANDMMKEACDTYRKNIGSHIEQGDINTKIDKLKIFGDIELVIGGPPCQGFSVAGKMDVNDPRSQLIWSYVKVIETVRPQAFIMENVKALATLDKWSMVRERLLHQLRTLGYMVNLMVLNASDFDVPQARERVFVIGFKWAECHVPDIETMIRPYAHKAPTVRETLRILDRAGEGNNKGTCKAKVTLAEHPILRKSPYAGMIFNGLGRPTRIDGYSATLPASMGGNKTPIIDEQELYEGKEAWVKSYHKKIMNDPTAAKFTPAPSFLRRLTVQEAALLQTFPIDYQFCGSQSAQYTQIGNAVPCNLGKAVVSMVIDVLREKRQMAYVYGTQMTINFD